MDEDMRDAKKSTSGSTLCHIDASFTDLLITIASGTPSWLSELHKKLWNRSDLHGGIFRLATLTQQGKILGALGGPKHFQKLVRLKWLYDYINNQYKGETVN